jgi:ubiquinone/menaquinone biosynthesis C-methylase UbiE
MNNDQRFSGLLGGEEYDLLKKALWYYDDLELAVANTIVKNIKSAEEVRMLEIGIGSGITTAFVLQACDDVKMDNYKIYAVDNETKMLEALKKRFQNISQIDFIESEIMDYLKSIDDNYFDVVFSGYVIHNFSIEKRNELFKEIARVTKKGGIFVNGDKCTVDDGPLQKEYIENTINTFEAFVQIGRSDVKEEWIKHYAEDEKVRFTESEQSRLLIQNNYESISTVYRQWMDSVMIAVKK